MKKKTKNSWNLRFGLRSIGADMCRLRGRPSSRGGVIKVFDQVLSCEFAIAIAIAMIPKVFFPGSW